jgi:hypothetical protein
MTDIFSEGQYFKIIPKHIQRVPYKSESKWIHSAPEINFAAF